MPRIVEPCTVEIGSLRERVEIIEAPSGPPRRRIGRIRHANGENVAIDHETLERLMERARRADEIGADGRGPSGRESGERGAGARTGWLAA